MPKCSPQWNDFSNRHCGNGEEEKSIQNSVSKCLCGTYFAQLARNGQPTEQLGGRGDNAPFHAKLETVFDDTGATMLHLAPYSYILTHTEIIRSKIKSYVNTCISPGFEELLTRRKIPLWEETVIVWYKIPHVYYDAALTMEVGSSRFVCKFNCKD